MAGLNLRGDTSGSVEIKAADAAGDNTLTLPNSDGTLLVDATSGGVSIADSISHTGDTDTAIRFPAADTFTVETAGSERLRIDSTGNSKFISNGRQIILRNDGTDSQPEIDFRNATDTGEAFGFISGATLDLQTAGTSRLHIENTGDIGIGTTNPQDTLHVMGEVRISDASDVSQRLRIRHDGIDFQNTGAGSSTSATAHLLDDYEEGTWTPEVLFGGSTGSNYTARQGSYVKVGGFVQCFGVIDLNGKGAATGSMAIAGLPFSVRNIMSATSLEGGGVMTYQTGLSGSQNVYGNLSVIPTEPGAACSIYYASSVNGEYAAVTDTVISNTFDCRFYCAYIATE